MDLSKDMQSCTRKQTHSADGECSFIGKWVGRNNGANCDSLICNRCIFHSLMAKQNGGAILFTASETTFTLLRNNFIQCGLIGSYLQGGAFYSNSKSVWMERNCMYRCFSSYECPAFYVYQPSGLLNSTLDVFVECGETNLFSYCGGSWTRGSATIQLNASHNCAPSKKYTFFVGVSAHGPSNGFYQVIQASICMNAAIEPLSPYTGIINFDSMNVVGNEGSGCIVRNEQSTTLSIVKSLFANNTHTGFGVSRNIENCSFCSNGFTTDIMCNPRKFTLIIQEKKCRIIPPTWNFTFFDEDLICGFISLTVMSIVGMTKSW